MQKNWLPVCLRSLPEELSENDKDAVMRALQDAYWMAKERNKEKYTPKKYRNPIEVEE